jgi:BRCT domain type II-containing protein
VSRPLATTAEVMIPGELNSSALKGSVAFTGRLACMSRAEAFEVVRQHGGTPSRAVTKLTNCSLLGSLVGRYWTMVVPPTSLLAQQHTASPW